MRLLSFSRAAAQPPQSHSPVFDHADEVDPAAAWSVRARVDRRRDHARFAVTLSNGHDHVVLYGEPKTASDINDGELLTDAQNAVRAWLHHVRTYRPQKRPQLPVRRDGFPRDREKRKGTRDCDRGLAA